jgi:hypothetical protein
MNARERRVFDDQAREIAKRITAQVLERRAKEREKDQENDQTPPKARQRHR